MPERTGGGRAWEGKPPALTLPPRSSAAASSLPMWWRLDPPFPRPTTCVRCRPPRAVS